MTKFSQRPDARITLRPLPHAGLLAGASLFLDFDGTLVTIADRPDDVVVDDALRDLIRNLHGRLDGRLAIISGRSAHDIAERIGMDELIIAGSHGLERRYRAGRIVSVRRPAALDAAAIAMDGLAATLPGVLVERKTLGCALHYRTAPAAADACHALARMLGERHDLAVQAGKMVVELRAPGADKGSAVAAFMAEPPFAGTQPVFIGDDVTDEAGFSVAAGLGGTGILVGPERETSAEYRLGDVTATLEWLAAEAGRAA